jgi:hypothetical protein
MKKRKAASLSPTEKAPPENPPTTSTRHETRNTRSTSSASMEPAQETVTRSTRSSSSSLAHHEEKPVKKEANIASPKPVKMVVSPKSTSGEKKNSKSNQSSTPITITPASKFH